MSMENYSAPDNVDNLSTPETPVELEDPDKVADGTERSLSHLENFLDKDNLRSKILEIKDPVKQQEYLEQYNKIPENCGEQLNLVAWEDVIGLDNLVASFGAGTKISKLSLREDEKTTERKEKLLNSDVSFDTIQQLNEDLNNGDKVLLLAALSKEWLKTKHLLVMASLMWFDVWTISASVNSWEISVPYVKKEGWGTFVFANWEIYHWKDEIDAASSWATQNISRPNNGVENSANNGVNLTITSIKLKNKIPVDWSIKRDIDEDSYSTTALVEWTVIINWNLLNLEWSMTATVSHDKDKNEQNVTRELNFGIGKEIMEGLVVNWKTVINTSWNVEVSAWVNVTAWPIELDLGGLHDENGFAVNEKTSVDVWPVKGEANFSYNQKGEFGFGLGGKTKAWPVSLNAGATYDSEDGWDWNAGAWVKISENVNLDFKVSPDNWELTLKLRF